MACGYAFLRGHPPTERGRAEVPLPGDQVARTDRSELGDLWRGDPATGWLRRACASAVAPAASTRTNARRTAVTRPTPRCSDRAPDWITSLDWPGLAGTVAGRHELACVPPTTSGSSAVGSGSSATLPSDAEHRRPTTAWNPPARRPVSHPLGQGQVQLPAGARVWHSAHLEPRSLCTSALIPWSISRRLLSIPRAATQPAPHPAPEETGGDGPETNWIYLLGIVVIIAVMIARKNVVVPAVAATFFTAWAFTGSLATGLTSVFNAGWWQRRSCSASS